MPPGYRPLPPGHPPRRSSRSPLLAVLLVFGLIGGALAGIGGVYYFAEARPKNYLEKWRWSFGHTDFLVRTYGYSTSEKAHVVFEQGCLPGTSPCKDVNPARIASELLARGGGTLGEREAGECFRDGCQHVFHREGHKGVAAFDKFTAPSYRLRIQIDLYW
ncbi:hypothetical protein ACIBF1_27900 [Spirillospora sp. NPDC050679]